MKPHPYFPYGNQRTRLNTPPLKGRRVRYPAGAPAPPPPAADYVITGTLTPDTTGDYNENGTYGGKPCYQHTNTLYWIWWYTPTMWIISSVLGGEAGWYWHKTFDPVEGNYTPAGSATGTATVTAG